MRPHSWRMYIVIVGDLIFVWQPSVSSCPYHLGTGERDVQGNRRKDKGPRWSHTVVESMMGLLVSMLLLKVAHSALITHIWERSCWPEWELLLHLGVLLELSVIITACLFLCLQTTSQPTCWFLHEWAHTHLHPQAHTFIPISCTIWGWTAYNYLASWRRTLTQFNKTGIIIISWSNKKLNFYKGVCCYSHMKKVHYFSVLCFCLSGHRKKNHLVLSRF